MQHRIVVVLLVLALPCAWYLGRVTAPAEISPEQPKGSQSASFAPSGSPRAELRAAPRITAASSLSGFSSTDTNVASAKKAELAYAQSSQETSAQGPAPHDVRSAAIDKFLADLIDKQKQGVFVSAFAQGYDLVRSEDIDPDWSPGAERALADYFPRPDVHSIECRQNICEIVVALPAGGDAEADAKAFRGAMTGLMSAPWLADQFDSSQTLSLLFHDPNGRPIYVTYLVRR